MTLQAAAQRVVAATEMTMTDLIDQPDRPSLPIRVPVTADFEDGSVMRAEVIGSTANVLLLQAPFGAPELPALGMTVRLKVEWDGQFLTGRMAAHGAVGRFLVTIGERAIRRSSRIPVDLPGKAKSAQQSTGAIDVRVTDLSAGGARVQGIDLPVGTEFELRFTPPGQPTPITVSAFVVREMERGGIRSVGVAFRLVQQSTDVLGRLAASPN